MNGPRATSPAQEFVRAGAPGAGLRPAARTALVGGGTMGDLIRAHDWACTPFGPLETWPTSLLVAVSLCLDSSIPTGVFFGADFRLIYNDAYAAMLADRHPWALGRPGSEVWTDAWHVIGPQFVEVVATGRGFSSDSQRFDLIRNGKAEETYFQYSFNPLRDETGRVKGIYNFGMEVTGRVLTERRQVFRARLADALNNLADPVAVIAGASERLGRHLDATRVTYGEVDEDRGTVLVEREWNDDSVPSVLGLLRLDDFGPVIEELRQGLVIAVDDVSVDPRTAGPMHLAGYRSIGVVAFLAAPLVKQGRLVAILGVHSGRPRPWSQDDRTLTLEVAERTWAAVERARAEASLRRSEARLRLALRGGRMGTWDVDLLTHQMECSDTCKANYGRRPGESFTYEDLAACIDPDDRDHWTRSVEAAVARGADFEVEYRVRWPDGTQHWVQVRGNCVADGSGRVVGLSGVSFDITDRRLAEERDRRAAAEANTAAETNAKFRAFYEQGAYFAGILALDGTMLDSNRVSYDACGFRPAEVIGRAFWDCGWWNLDPFLVDEIRAAVAQAAGGTPFHGEKPYFIADGYRRHVDLFLTPVVDESGRALFVAATGVDVTNRKRAEDDLRTLAADLSNADHRKDEFLAMLGHELRNPLSAISGAVQLAELTEAPELPGELRDLIHRQVGHLTRLIDDLLDVSRITQGKIALRVETIDLATTVGRALDQVRPLIAAKRHILTVQLPDEPVRFVADPTRVEQILGNLLTNAAKYTEPDGRIDLLARVEGGEVVVRVSDSGVGIDPEMLPEVFGLFTQVDATIDRSQGGLGIGLTLVRNLVERHGGTITAASPGKGHGSEFTVRLPVGHPNSAATPAPEARPARPATESARRILVVDDNQDTARLTARMLRHAGFDVAVAHDGLEAVKLAPTLHPAVVLLDIGLPGMNGYEVAAALRRDPDCQAATIIAVSGYGEDKARDRSAAAGFDHHLAKPVDFTKLLALIDA